MRFNHRVSVYLGVTCCVLFPCFACCLPLFWSVLFPCVSFFPLPPLPTLSSLSSLVSFFAFSVFSFSSSSLSCFLHTSNIRTSDFGPSKHDPRNLPFFTLKPEGSWWHTQLRPCLPLNATFAHVFVTRTLNEHGPLIGPNIRVTSDFHVCFFEHLLVWIRQM